MRATFPRSSDFIDRRREKSVSYYYVFHISC